MVPFLVVFWGTTLLGIGGSSTNDAGMGMARALGYRLLNENGEELIGKGADLNDLHRIDSTQVMEGLRDVKFEVACDVDNPLYGSNGAAYIYSPQKGASDHVVKVLDSGLKHFSSVVDNQFGKDLHGISGAGKNHHAADRRH